LLIEDAHRSYTEANRTTDVTTLKPPLSSTSSKEFNGLVQDGTARAMHLELPAYIDAPGNWLASFTRAAN
jgi:hypothetical protein